FPGGTVVAQGVLNVQNNDALGTASGASSTSTVLDGAQLQLQGGVTVNAKESLRLSGTGIFGSGALENISGANKWEGPVTLAQDAGFNLATTPPINVGIATLYTSVGDSLAIDGAIGEAVANMGISKLGLGSLALNNTNTYSGATTAFAGELRI